MSEAISPTLVSLDPKSLSRAAVSDGAKTHLATPETAGEKSKRGFSFGDFLDMINPLQHIPIVNTLYRAITGDTIRAEAKLVGGGLFGGPIGLALSAADVALEAETGRDAGGHVLALLKGNKPPAAATLAKASQPALPTLTEEQWTAVTQALESPKPAANRNDDRAEAAAERLAARQLAYDKAMGTMADALARARALDRLPPSAKVETGGLPPL